MSSKREGACHRRKQQQIENQLRELGMESLQKRLEDAAETPAKPPYRLARLIQVPAASVRTSMAVPARWLRCIMVPSSQLIISGTNASGASHTWEPRVVGYQATDRQACDGVGSCEALAIINLRRCWGTCSQGDHYGRLLCNTYTGVTIQTCNTAAVCSTGSTRLEEAA